MLVHGIAVIALVQVAGGLLSTVLPRRPAAATVSRSSLRSKTTLPNQQARV